MMRKRSLWILSFLVFAVVVLSSCQPGKVLSLRSELASQQAIAGKAFTGLSCTVNDDCTAANNEICFDTDGNGNGDTCVVDTDGDGVADDGDGSGSSGDDNCVADGNLICDDNCVAVQNQEQNDADSDGIGDACEPSGASAGGGEESEVVPPETEEDPCATVVCGDDQQCVEGSCFTVFGGEGCGAVDCVAGVACSSLENVCGGLGVSCIADEYCSSGKKCIGGECGLPREVWRAEASDALTQLEASKSESVDVQVQLIVDVARALRKVLEKLKDLEVNPVCGDDICHSTENGCEDCFS